MRNPAFGHLLTGAINSIAAYEAKTVAAVEMEFGEKLGVSPSTIQRYKSGQVPPEPEIIKFFSEEGVRRGYLNREWLERFLRSARYPASAALIERLFPHHVLVASERVYQNLPAPTYNQFVMRARAFADVVEGLRQRSAVVLITSLGGMGKTCLAREVAAHCMRGHGDLPSFQAIVWISDKERAGTTNLSVVLDEIARTLDYPGFTSLPFEDKRYEVDQLLRRQRVLLVIDNFETITDSALLSWLLRLPEPSKALVTSREYSADFRSCWPVDLRGMSKEEAGEFMLNQLRFLRLESLVDDPSEMEPLSEVTGGNPKAIMLALGYLKHSQRPLDQVVNEIYAGRGDLFDDLIARTWQLLGDSARRVLMAMTLFPVNASKHALSEVSAVQGYAFDRAAERLGETSLLDTSRPSLRSAPRYSLHPLVRAFARSKLSEFSAFEKEAHQRWLDVCLRWAEEVKSARYDMGILKVIELEEATIESAIWWCKEEDVYPQINYLIDGIGYYYLVRGMWDKKLVLHPLAAEFARRHDDRIAEIDALSKYVQILSRQSNWKEADQYRPRLHELVHAGVPDNIMVDYLNAESFYWLYQGNISQIKQLWEDHKYLAHTPNGHMVRSWLADCLLAERHWEEAAALLSVSLIDVTTNHIQRGMIAVRIKLIAIALQQGKQEQAADELKEISRLASENLDRQYMAFIQSYYGCLYSMQNNIPAAQEAHKKALDLFERLGMRMEAQKVRTMLRDTEEGRIDCLDLPQLP